MEKENQTLRYVRINAYLTAAILVVICVVAALLVPRTVRTLARAEETLGQIGELSQAVGSTMKTADSALTAANAAADTANQIAADNADAVAEALQKFNSVDFTALNKAINDLADIVEPLAKVSNFLNR